MIVKRALLSCANKTGLEVLAKALAELGVELIASGGTAKFLIQQGLPVKTVEQFAGITQQLDGRVKTLHPKIHAGILARREDPAHLQAVGADGLIDLVVVDLYPFESAIQQRDAAQAEAIEQIDIGGVALLRAAAKNFAHVVVVSRPEQYPRVAEALRSSRGQVPPALRRELAAQAFDLTAAYDRQIAGYLQPSPSAEASEAVTIRLRKRQALRYGENPHQAGAWHVPADAPPWGLATLRQSQGKELSYNNLLDIDATLRCLIDFSRPGCAIVKHGSQCGVASAQVIQQAYERALACDAESAFGGVVGCNRPVDAELARRLTETFLEVVVAPSVSPEALDVFRKKPNLRVMTVEWPNANSATLEWRHVLGSWLAQQPDAATEDLSALAAATQRAPTPAEAADLQFAWMVAKHVQSNAIVLAKHQATVGIGQGQPSRVGSARVAVEKAGERSRGAVAASDGFFPFADGVELLAKAGVTAVVQPGGSIRDREVIAAADAANIAMVLTGVRHFRH